MFAAGIFRSPSSFFGHVFLKFGLVGPTAGGVLSDPAVEELLRRDSRGLRGGISCEGAGWRLSRALPLARAWCSWSEHMATSSSVMSGSTVCVSILSSASCCSRMPTRCATFVFPITTPSGFALRIVELLNVVLETDIVSENDSWLTPLDVVQRVAAWRRHDRAVSRHNRREPRPGERD